jgi:hypothetical protein
MGKISFIMDTWTDLNRKAYMAVTAHWLEKASVQMSSMLQPKINLRTDLIGFKYIPESHTGGYLAETFLSIIDGLKITKKVCCFIY